jgi:tetratricopeptide (TPR) repeat protein
MAVPKIFICYSGEDSQFRDLLIKHLNVSQRNGKLTYFVDIKIEAGKNWFPEIKKNIEASDVAIMIISADFLISEFVQNVEVPEFIRRRTEEGLVIYPIYYRNCTWKQVSWLEQIQMRPRKPLDGLQANQIEEKIVEIIEEIIDLPSKVNQNDFSIEEENSSSKFVFQQIQPIGRTKELDEANTKLKKSKILLLYGSPGQGKTELARYIAVSNSNYYEDGIFEVDLQNEKQIDNIKKHIAKAFGNMETGNVFQLLNSKKTLIILDSFEGIQKHYENNPEALKKFVDTLVQNLGDNSKIIITSQQKLQHDYVVAQRVNRLNSEAALELFLSNTEGLYEDTEMDDIGSFLDKELSGHPLSIKIVKKFNESYKLEFEDLKRFWKDKWNEIAEFGRVIDTRALTASFELSFSALKDTEKLYFLAMSLLPDGIQTKQIKEIWKNDEATAYRALSVLNERSLVEDEKRLRKMLGPIFKFAQEKRNQIENDKNNIVREQLIEIYINIDTYYDDFVNHNAPQYSDIDTRQKNQLIIDNFYNIHASIDRRLGLSTSENSLSAANSVLSLYWSYHNNLSGYKNAIASADDAINYLEKALQIFEINNEQGKVTECNYYLGTIFWLRGEIEKAKPYMNTVLNSSNNHEKMKLDCMRAFAHIEYKNGSIAKSVKLYEDVIEGCKKINYDDCRIKCHTGIIDAYRKLESFDKALEYYNSIKVEVAPMHPNIKGNVIRGVAYILYLDDKLNDAEKFYFEASDIFSTVSPFGQAHCRRGLGDVYVKMKKFEDAENEFDHALRLYEEARKNPSLGVGLVFLGQGRLIKNQHADFKRALEYFHKAQYLFSRNILNEPYEEAQALELIGDTLYFLQEKDKALGHLQLAKKLYEQCDVSKSIERINKRIELIKLK